VALGAVARGMARVAMRKDIVVGWSCEFEVWLNGSVVVRVSRLSRFNGESKTANGRGTYLERGKLEEGRRGVIVEQ
jgi:hypothetical protein